MHWVFTVVNCGDAVVLVRDLQHDIFLWLQPAYGAQQQASYGYTQQGGQGGAVAQAAQGLAPDQQARVSQIVAQVTIFTQEHSRQVWADAAIRDIPFHLSSVSF